MTRIAICDDSPEQVVIIRAALERYLTVNGKHSTEIMEFHNPSEYLDYVEKNGGFDIALLDIIMSGINGIELAKQLRINDKDYQLIFITTTREFAVEAIALKSTHYIIKPFTDLEFDEAMNRAFENISKKEKKSFSLKSRSGEYYKVNLSELISIECFGHFQKLYCLSFSFEMRESWLYLNEKIIDSRFFMIRKGVTVNMDCIKFVGSNYIKMVDGRSLSVAKRIMPEFKKKYLDYAVGR